jgi:hypothetical protein
MIDYKINVVFAVAVNVLFHRYRKMCSESLSAENRIPRVEFELFHTGKTSSIKRVPLILQSDGRSCQSQLYLPVPPELSIIR